MQHAHQITARQLAAQWRANPADRPRIEREIADAGRADEFTRNRWGELIAHVAPRPVVGESFRSLNITPLSEMLSAEQVALAGLGFTKTVKHPVHGYAIIDADDLPVADPAHLRRAAA